jgi:hypothetical protein
MRRQWVAVSSQRCSTRGVGQGPGFVQHSPVLLFIDALGSAVSAAHCVFLSSLFLFYDMSETLVDVCPSNEQIAVSDVSSTHNVCAVCNVKSIKGYCQVVPILV